MFFLSIYCRWSLQPLPRFLHYLVRSQSLKRCSSMNLHLATNGTKSFPGEKNNLLNPGRRFMDRPTIGIYCDEYNLQIKLKMQLENYNLLSFGTPESVVKCLQTRIFKSTDFYLERNRPDGVTNIHGPTSAL